jgi:XTP/dITP diphosphohydrolase
VASPDKFFEGSAGSAPVLLASSNGGKLREYQELAENSAVEVALIPNFASLPPFEEAAPTFAENAAGKALYFSAFASGLLLADDSGLVVPALDGAPGVHSARYAGPHATSGDRVRKLLHEMEGLEGDERLARFVCVIALARRGRVVAVVSDFVEGRIAGQSHGSAGFGYDPVFFIPELGRTFGEASAEEKNRYSHRGRAFRKALRLLGPGKNTLTPL